MKTKIFMLVLSLFLGLNVFSQSSEVDTFYIDTLLNNKEFYLEVQYENIGRGWTRTSNDKFVAVKQNRIFYELNTNSYSINNHYYISNYKVKNNKNTCVVSFHVDNVNYDVMLYVYETGNFSMQISTFMSDDVDKLRNRNQNSNTLFYKGELLPLSYNDLIK